MGGGRLPLIDFDGRDRQEIQGKRAAELHAEKGAVEPGTYGIRLPQVVLMAYSFFTGYIN